MDWTPEAYAAAKVILKKYPRNKASEALEAVASSLGTTRDAIVRAFRRHGQGPAASFCTEAKEPQEAAPTIPARLDALVKATKRVHGFEELCDKLDVSPGKLRKLLEEAQEAGLHLHVDDNGTVGRKPLTDDKVQQAHQIKPTTGETYKIGVISDTHLGSKYCLRAQLQDFIFHAYDQGVRTILHPGDILDGDYRHAKFEMSHMGLEDQAKDLFQTLPKLPGLTYHGITGNHDFTFTEANGIDVGTYLEMYFKHRGRSDLKLYGDRSAFIELGEGGAIAHLWHPKSGTGYAKSYKVQRLIETYASGEKPHILLVGHWHIFNHVMERGVHGIACPTFQGGGSAFSRSLGGAPAIGGLVLTYSMTEDRTMRDFNLSYRAYYEVEQPRSAWGDSTVATRQVKQGTPR